MKKIKCDVAVIGGGPAGLAAAISAYDHGAGEVILIERDKFLGGILQQCIHNGFGLHQFNEDLTGPEYAARFISELHDRPIRFFLNTMVLQLARNRKILAVSATEGLTQIAPKAVVLAMGCRERTREAIKLPGHRPAGIMTAGTAQRFINVEGYLPGREIVILGSGDIGMIMARRLFLEGCIVKAVVEIEKSVSGLTRNLVQCLYDFNIPLYLNHTVTDISGIRRVEGVDIAPLDKKGKPDKTRSFPIKCDTLLLSFGLIPENELTRQADVLIDPRPGVPVVDQHYQTSIAGIFGAGNVVQVFDLVDHVSSCGMKAGKSAACFALGELTEWEEGMCRVLSGNGVSSVVPQRLSGYNDKEVLKFYIRSNDVNRKVRLQLMDKEDGLVFTKMLPVVRPPEMIIATVRDVDFTRSNQYTFSLVGGSQ